VKLRKCADCGEFYDDDEAVPADRAHAGQRILAQKREGTTEDPDEETRPRRRRRRALDYEEEPGGEALRQLAAACRPPTKKSEEGSMAGRVRETLVEAVDGAIEKFARAAHPRDDAATAVSKFMRTEMGATLYELRDVLGAAQKTGASAARNAADAMLEAHARSIQKREPGLSAEQAYVRAMAEHPDVADVAVNG